MPAHELVDRGHERPGVERTLEQEAFADRVHGSAARDLVEKPEAPLRRGGRNPAASRRVRSSAALEGGFSLHQRLAATRTAAFGSA